jgi:uncharacterized protein (DUF2336 family)
MRSPAEGSSLSLGHAENVSIPLPASSAEAVGSFRARAELTARLCEVVTWPSTRIAASERQLAADVLMALLRSAPAAERQRLADRLAMLVDPPRALLRYLATDEIGVSRRLLEEGVGFDDSDLMAVIRGGYLPHRLLVAARKGLSELLADELIRLGDPGVILKVLSNPKARISQTGIDLAVSASQKDPSLTAALLQRPELKPSQALVIFWWSAPVERLLILRRYAAERRTLAEEVTEAFRLAAAENWQDPEVRKALQVIERRGRNRAAASKSPFESIEHAIDAAIARGMTKFIATEIGYLAGVKPVTIVRVLTDRPGEAIGVFAKAVGLKRGDLDNLWTVLRRPIGEMGDDTPYTRMRYVYDILSTAKAQTALRYWNWSFSADAQDVTKTSIEESEDALLLQPARRNAALLFGRFGSD